MLFSFSHVLSKLEILISFYIQLLDKREFIYLLNLIRAFLALFQFQYLQQFSFQ